MATIPPSDLREFVQYVITAVDANPDLREPLLRALLTEEFLQVPVRLARVEDDVKTLKDDVAILKDDVAILKDDVATLKDDVATLKDDVTTLKDDMGRVKGKVLEEDVAHRATSWLNREFGFLRNRVVHGKAGVFWRYGEEFLDAVADAQENGLITSEQAQRLLDTDIIVQCHRAGEVEPTWVTVEVAARIDEADINRALRSAEVLRTVSGAEVLPVVAGERVDSPDVERARESGVTVISFAE